MLYQGKAIQGFVSNTCVLEDIGTNWKVEEMIKKWKQTGKWEFRMFATLAFNELRLNIQIHF